MKDVKRKELLEHMAEACEEAYDNVNDINVKLSDLMEAVAEASLEVAESAVRNDTLNEVAGIIELVFPHMAKKIRSM